ncbi:MAG: efflux RND transporter periplasmic adaptor subunit [Xanthomonadales bacterium]|nr:efflux RND transporter periplasmic adaptor subunit [Xanthomonadales bacterium]
MMFSLLALTTQVFAESGGAVAVTVSKVKHEQRSQPIRNSGRISHKNEMRLSFKTGGLIEQINVEEGDEVGVGQILATLDLEEINAQQQRAASNYKNAAADLERFSKLHKDALVSLQVKQNAQMAYDSAEAELQIANFNKKLSVIRAPANGRILKRFAESSELIQPGQPVFLLASNQQGSVVRVGLIDQDIVKVGVGDPVEIFLDAYPGRTFTGKVSEVALSTDSNAGTFEVEILIDDQGFALRSGLIARVEITPVSGDLQYFIPIESVFKADNGLARVFVLDEDTRKVNEVSVEIVEFLTDEVAVRGSLKASDKVIKLGAPYLTDGSVVSVIDDS